MAQDALEPVSTNVSFSNVRMPVAPRSQGVLRIVRMHHADVLKPQPAARLADCLAQAVFTSDVVAGCKEMAGVEAVADGQVGGSGSLVANGAHLLKARADGAA